VKCPLCAKQARKVLTSELRNSKGRVLWCEHCDLGILEKQIADPAAYYSSEYRKTHRNALDEHTPKQIYQNMVNYQASRLKIVGQYAKKRGKFLEIGCSAGQFLSHLKGKHELYCEEHDKGCVDFCRKRFGVKVFSYLDNFFDYVAMFQVLEHVKDSIGEISYARESLKPGGYLFLEVPNLYDSMRSVWNNAQYNKFFFHEAHNWYFSEKSLRIIANKAGFEVVDVQFTQDYTFYAHINWYFTGKSQNNVHLGMRIPEIGAGKFHSINEMNAQLGVDTLLYAVQMEYEKILSENKVSSNIFMVLRRPV